LQFGVVPFTEAVQTRGVSALSTQGFPPDHTPLGPVISALAARQHDIVLHAQLLGAGLTRQAIALRVRRGVLHRRYRGVYSLGPAPLSREAELHAVVLAIGAGAALSHLSAAELHALTRTRPPLIAVVSPRKRTLPGVTVHRYRTLDPRDVTSHRGIPVTTVHRTLVDLSDVLTPLELTAIINEAAFQGRFVEPAVRDAMRRANGRHNLHVLDEAIALYSAGSAGIKSKGELAFLTLGLPGSRVNTRVLGFEVDFLWPDLKLIVEIDGPQHTRPTTKRDDAARDRAHRAAGYTTLRFTDEDVKYRPDDVRKAVEAWVSNRGTRRAA
jgi:hypothetical protein